MHVRFGPGATGKGPAYGHLASGLPVLDATPDREIRVRFAREAGTVLLAVWDSSAKMPVVQPVVEMTLDDIVPDVRALDVGHDDGTGGWGLPLVQALATECGVTETRPGKWMWARVAC